MPELQQPARCRDEPWPGGVAVPVDGADRIAATANTGADPNTAGDDRIAAMYCTVASTAHEPLGDVGSTGGAEPIAGCTVIGAVRPVPSTASRLVERGRIRPSECATFATANTSPAPDAVITPGTARMYATAPTSVIALGRTSVDRTARRCIAG